MARTRQQKYPGWMPEAQRIQKARFNHHSPHEPVLRRRRGRAATWLQEVEFYAYSKQILPGTILERLLAKRLDELGYSWAFQFDVDLPQLAKARLDFAVFGTGIGKRAFMGIEPEGELWHLDVEKDMVRTLQLRQLGIVVVHLWEADMLASRERFDVVVRDALRGVEYPRPPRSTQRRPDFSSPSAMG